MRSRSFGPDRIEAEIGRLPGLGLAELRRRWLALCGRPAPKFLRRKLLVRALAHQMQVEAYGGLSPQTVRRLRAIAAATQNGNADEALAAPRLKPGTHLLRLWQDQTHCVTVGNDGFEWQGKRYKTLSAVARAITGTNWNGYAFFGLKRRAARNKNAERPRSRSHG